MPELPLLPLILVALGIVNLLTIHMFWLDKHRAQRGNWRVPEANLLLLAVLGGTPAAFLSRHLLRHKRRKEPFSTHLQVIAVIQAGATAGYLLF